jgi:hypothetical protein
MTHPLEERIDRREALRRAALLLGGTLSAPVIAGVLAGCDASDSAATKTPSSLTPAQAELVASIAERIIPETDTPGARGAGVPRFIETMLAEYYTSSERSHFLDGLAGVDARAQRGCGRSFARCSTKEQHELLEQIDRETYASTAAAVPPPFFRTMKELTILGYYTSKIGATRELQHRLVPGRYEGCVPLGKIGRTWAV